MNGRLTDERLAEILPAVAAYADHPDLGFACCSAHGAADAAADLLAEVQRLNAEREKYVLVPKWEYELMEGQRECAALAQARIDKLEAERGETAARVRDDIADEVHRAELPTFAATENPVLVAKVVRAVDVRIVDMGYAAPYFAPGSDAGSDTFPAWLAHRFDPQGAPWDGMSDDDRQYWEHQARAVQRAVARGGFKAESGGAR